MGFPIFGVALGALHISPSDSASAKLSLSSPRCRTKICIQHQHEENIDKCPPLNAINNLNYVAKPNFIANTNSHNNSMAKQMASLLLYTRICICAYTDHNFRGLFTRGIDAYLKQHFGYLFFISARGGHVQNV